MTQVAFAELRAFERERACGVALRPVFVTKGDVGVGDGEEARVGDDAARDVSAEVFDGVLPAAEGLDVDAPSPRARRRAKSAMEGQGWG